MIYLNNVSVLREQLRYAHDTMEATMNDVDSDTAHERETNKALPVGAAYVHAVLGEDMVVATMLAHTPPLATDPSTIGLSELMPTMAEWEKHDAWAKSVHVDIPTFRAFAKRVYEATDTYLSGLSDKDLEKEIAIPGMGNHSLLFVISNFVILHMANLTGEVSAAKGFQGKKGYPF